MCPFVTCLNDGVCNQTGPAEYHCDCPSGYRSTHCELDACDGSNPQCLLGSTCSEVPAGIECACQDNTEGTFCESYTCTPDPCQNGASCEIGFELFCQCAFGFSGEFCETQFEFERPGHENATSFIEFSQPTFGVSASSVIAASTEDDDFDSKVTGADMTNYENYDIAMYCILGFNLAILLPISIYFLNEANTPYGSIRLVNAE